MRFSEFKLSEDFSSFMGRILGSTPQGIVGDVVDKVKSAAATGSEKANSTKSIQDPNFDSKLKKVAEALGVAEADLRKIIRFETAGTFSPTSHDPWNVSIGLIGFTEKTAKALGTSKAELAKMTAVQQLDYVHNFYKMNKLRPGSDVGTMYMLTFMPADAYASDGKVLGKKGGGKLDNTGLSMHKVWEQNPAFGKSKGKNYFTVGDVKSSILSR
jgi:hypothetical protein